jgi:hypothetical protein
MRYEIQVMPYAGRKVNAMGAECDRRAYPRGLKVVYREETFNGVRGESEECENKREDEAVIRWRGSWRALLVDTGRW